MFLQEFERLAADHNLCVRIIPLNEHHEQYCAEDIELWEVVRSRPLRNAGAVNEQQQQMLCDSGSCNSESGAPCSNKNISTHKDAPCSALSGQEHYSQTTTPLHLSVPACVVTRWGAVPYAAVTLRGIPVLIEQDTHQRLIGAALWPSAVIVSRYSNIQ